MKGFLTASLIVLSGCTAQTMDRERIGAAMVAASAGMQAQPRPVTCTTTGFGTVVGRPPSTYTTTCQ